MLSSAYKIQDNSTFKLIQKEGKIVQSPSFGLAYLKRGDNERSKFGFIISNKISNLSVLRHRVRRALSEAVRFNSVDLKSGYDAVFLAKSESLRRSTEQIMGEVKESLRKAGIIE